MKDITLPKPGSRQSRNSLLGCEIIHSYWVLEEGIVPRHYRNSAFSYEIALAVGFGIVSDRCAFGDVYIAVDNGFSQAAVASYIHVCKQDAVFDLTVGIYPHIWRQHAVLHRAA